MTGEYYFTSFLALALRFLPTILDSGIQIWNGVVVDQMVKSEEIGYPGPFFIAVPQRRRRSTEESSSIFNIHLTEGWTLEGLVSIGLVQLPGLFLAIYGITKALDKAIERPGNYKQAAKDSLHASVLMFLPFFLIEIVSFFEFSFSSAFNACFGFLYGQGIKQFVKKFDFLHFLGKKDPTGKAKLLCLDASKVFFGSCLQLCLQVVLLQFSFVKRPSQLLSILSSCLVITKTCFEIITYQRNDENSNESENKSENGELDEKEESENNKAGASKGNAIKGVLIKVLKMCWGFLKYFPLLGSSLLFNIGTLTISVILLGWYSGIVIALVILAHIFTATMLSFNKTVRKADKYHLTLYGARLGSQ